MVASELDQFEERAAILQFDAGLKRFEAETKAARMQGKERWEVMNEIGRRNSGGSRDQG